MPRLLRLRIMNGAETPLTRGSRYVRESSPPGSFSTLMTSAPMSASIIPAVGPAMICASSSTRKPASGPECGGRSGVGSSVCIRRASASDELGLALGKEGRVADAEVLGVEAVEALVEFLRGQRTSLQQVDERTSCASARPAARHRRCAARSLSLQPRPGHRRRRATRVPSPSLRPHRRPALRAGSRALPRDRPVAPAAPSRHRPSPVRGS